MEQIKIHGLGGQGVVTAAKILSEAVAIVENRFAQAIPAYGHERRGAPVHADVVISDQPIRIKSFVYEPDYVVVFDLAVLEKSVDVMAGTTTNTVFIVNAANMGRAVPFHRHRIYFVDARRISLETILRDIPNAAMLGAMAGTGLVGIEAVKQSVAKTFGKAGALNATAAQRAYEQLELIQPDRGPVAQTPPLRNLAEWQADQAHQIRYLYGPVATVFASVNTGAWRIARPNVDLAACSFCLICERYCPVDAVTVLRTVPSRDVQFNYAFCKGCGICADVCPKKCISMIDER